ncbi:hypothetical protein Mterra_03610 [Calidithermus terrae]|uniref:Uncharacterized protein n=1 Tax=Calidithermus terrae TaxID=1408545 RepID=A0A399E5Y9_9DEIN|nr:hypothetical protein Mterra_03610 [Calidithermus terrae]
MRGMSEVVRGLLLGESPSACQAWPSQRAA